MAAKSARKQRSILENNSPSRTGKGRRSPSMLADGFGFVTVLDGEKKDEVATLTLESFMPLGIKELLTMQRQVGFASLIDRVVRIAND